MMNDGNKRSIGDTMRLFGVTKQVSRVVTPSFLDVGAYSAAGRGLEYPHRSCDSKLRRHRCPQGTIEERTDLDIDSALERW